MNRTKGTVAMSSVLNDAPTEPSVILEIAQALEADGERLVRRQIELVRTHTSFADAPEQYLRRSTARNLARIVDLLRGKDPRTTDIYDDDDSWSTLRSAPALTTRDLMAAYRESIGVIRDMFIALANERDVPEDVIVENIRSMWDLTDHDSDVIAEARHRVDYERARKDERSRLEFLQRVLLGSVSIVDAADIARSFGIGPHDQLWVLRARGSQESLTSVGYRIESACRAPGFSPLLGAIDADLVALTTVAPEVGDGDWSVVVNGPVGLSDLPRAFAKASNLLAVAARFGQSGEITPQSLGIKIAVASEEEIGAIFLERYVTPVLSSSFGGEDILRTIRAHLANDCRVDATAKALYVHPNTVRNRLEKFEQLAAVDFDDFESRFEVWWAIQYWIWRSGDPRGSSGAPGF